MVITKSLSSMLMSLKKPKRFARLLMAEGVEGEIPFATFGGVIGTHLGDHSLAVGYIPIV